MAEKIIKGRDLMLFDNDGHSFSYATNHVLTITAETTDISSKDHGVWGGSEIARYTWEITSENLYTEKDYDKMFELMITGEPFTVRFGLKQTPDDPTLTPADDSTTLPYWTSQSSYYEGKAVLTSLVANASNGDNATYNITLTGNGSIKKVTTNQQPSNP